MKTATEAARRPHVTEFDNYRDLLDAFFMHRKLTRRGFSFRAFSRTCGLSSPGFFGDVIAGRKKLNVRLAESAAKALGLDEPETRYFSALVAFEEATDASARLVAQSTFQRVRTELLAISLDEGAKARLATWYAMTLRDLVLLPGYRGTPEEISSLFRGLVSPAEVERTLATLEREGLLSKDASGAFSPGRSPIVIQGERSPYENFGILMQILDFWRVVLPTLPRELTLTNVAGIPIPLSKVPELRARMDAFCDGLIGESEAVSSEKEPSDTVVHLGFFVVPIVAPKNA